MTSVMRRGHSSKRAIPLSSGRDAPAPYRVNMSMVTERRVYTACTSISCTTPGTEAIRGQATRNNAVRHRIERAHGQRPDAV